MYLTGLLVVVNGQICLTTNILFCKLPISLMRIWLITFLTDAAISPSGSTTVEASNDVILTCTSSSQTSWPTSYSWHRVNSSIPSDSIGQNSDTFTIRGVDPEDEGEYYCIIEAFSHCGRSVNVMVIVEGKKIISLIHTYNIYSSIAMSNGILSCLLYPWWWQ